MIKLLQLTLKLSLSGNQRRLQYVLDVFRLYHGSGLRLSVSPYQPNRRQNVSLAALKIFFFTDIELSGISTTQLAPPPSISWAVFGENYRWDYLPTR